MPFFTGAGQSVGAIVGGGVAAGAAAVADVAGTSGTGHLRIEPDQVDGAIAVFKEALAAVEDEVRAAISSIRADPPASDQVSVDAADAFNRVGYGNDNSAIAAWEGAITQLRSIIQQLEASRQANVNADVAGSGSFQPPG